MITRLLVIAIILAAVLSLGIPLAHAGTHAAQTYNARIAAQIDQE